VNRNSKTPPAPEQRAGMLKASSRFRSYFKNHHQTAAFIRARTLRDRAANALLVREPLTTPPLTTTT